MHSGIEAFLNGARMARQLAATETNPSERERHIDRAEWYEEHAQMMIDHNERRQVDLMEAAE